MKQYIHTAAIIVLGLTMISPAQSAAYIKFDGVDGESKAAATHVKSAEKPQPVGLLLPAVQSAREAARRHQSSKKKGKVDASWKVEEGTK